MSKKLVTAILLIVLSLLATSVVGAQAATHPAVVYVYDGSQVGIMHGSNLAFQPGDTTAAPVILESTVPFTVISYVDNTARDNDVRLGNGQSTCAATLTGQSCTLSISGTNGNMWLDLVFAPTMGKLTEFSYNGVVIGRFIGSNLAFQPGDTTGAPKSLGSTLPFTVVNYASKAMLEAGTPLGSMSATCNSLVGVVCDLMVGGTTSQMWLEIVPNTAQPVLTPTPQAGAIVPVTTPTPNALLGQGGANPAAITVQPMVYPAAGQWVFVNNPASTNPRQANWQAFLSQYGLDPEKWLTPVNMPNPLVPEFRVVNGNEVPDGAAVAAPDHTYGEQDDYLNVYSAAGHLRYISADYNLPALGVECHQENNIGCILIIANTGSTAVTFEDQMVKNGFSYEGPFFNGETLGMALWGTASHGAANMLDMSTLLNAQAGVNFGSNCGLATACRGVLVTIVGHSGGTVEWTGRYLYTTP